MRQFYFLDYNFTFINAFFGFGLISFLILTKTYFKNSLLFAGSCFLSLGLVSVLFFPGLSYYDPAYQMGFGLAYICLLGGFLINMKKRIWVGPHVKIFTFSLLIPLVVVTLFSALGLRYNIYSAQFAKADDISYLSSVSKRIVYFRSEISGPVEWWESPVVSYYTSRFYRGDRVQLGVVPYSKSLRLNRSSDRLVLSKSVPQSIRYQLLSKVLSPNVPVVSKTTSSFLFYTWKPAPPPKVEEVLISD